MKLPLLTALLAVAAPIAAPAQSPATAPDVTAARASLVGRWQGELGYRDYGANRWFGIPVKTQIIDQGDGATMLRVSDFDDGPKVGTVRITSGELFDAQAGTVSVATFRKARSVEVTTYAVRIDPASRDATHWTMIEETKGADDNRPAALRLTTVRDGDKLETLKQIDFLDDDKAEWLTRNRTRLTRVGD
ncbi:hypothetical protein C7451_109136 [Blastomonas natatoria]|uniref:THAP4-like heme-binding beta-barrel domain-containing protein n=1 Tax=Blastomonas natatoria TaxID=34015 RepID=A0A2V3UX80_9SPHN|nr:hypothetical protein [Blastomonas natatoria]PXW73847.1 hypothetical protein C7451_109136 [Blastomonas natatoria]